MWISATQNQLRSRPAADCHGSTAALSGRMRDYTDPPQRRQDGASLNPERLRVKRQRFADVDVPIFPIVVAWKFLVFVRDAKLLEMGVISAIVFDQEIVRAAVNAQFGQARAFLLQALNLREQIAHAADRLGGL